MSEKFDLMLLCAKATIDIPHEPDCNSRFGSSDGTVQLACTCESRTERIATGLAALLRSVASRRDSLRHHSTESICRSLLARFRKAASADVRIEIRVRRSGVEQGGLSAPQGAQP